MARQLALLAGLAAAVSLGGAREGHLQADRADAVRDAGLGETDSGTELAARSGKDVAFAGVFSFGVDPQAGKVYEKDSRQHIALWADSVQRLGLQGVVLHDDAYSPAFVERERSEALGFARMDLEQEGLHSDEARTNLTTSDWRFIAFHDYLEQHQDELRYVLLTDAHDVEFRRDPFRYMRALDEAADHGYVYGQEEWRPRVALFDPTKVNESGEEITAFSRLKPYWKACFGTPMPEAYTLGRMPNCAILGGRVEVVLPFLKRMGHWYSKVPQHARFQMCDMLVYMRTVMEDYGDHYISGYPWHATFKEGDHGQEKAVIYHKHSLPGWGFPGRGSVETASAFDLPAAHAGSLVEEDEEGAAGEEGEEQSLAGGEGEELLAHWPREGREEA